MAGYNGKTSVQPYRILDEIALNRLAELSKTWVGEAELALAILEDINRLGPSRLLSREGGLPTYLNSLRVLSLSEDKVLSAAIRKVLLNVASSAATHVRDHTSHSFMIDVFFIWLQCWVTYAGTLEHFIEGFSRETILPKLLRDPFLATELIRAVARSNDADTATMFLAPTLEQCFGYASPDRMTASAIGTTCARLTSVTTRFEVDSPASLALVDACIAAGPSALEAFWAESDRCEAARSSAGEQDGRGSVPWSEVSSAVSMAELSWAEGTEKLRLDRKSNILSLISQEPLAERFSRVTSAVDSIIVRVHKEESRRAFGALLTDVDAAVRCVGAHRFLSPESGAQLLRSELSDEKLAFHELRDFRRDSVRTAMVTSSNRWLVDGIVKAYEARVNSTSKRVATVEPPTAISWSTPPLSTLGCDDQFDSAILESVRMRPDQRMSSGDKIRSVALLLPSITPDIVTDSDIEGSLANKGSPPLGLGQIATYLSSLGHFVRIFDAHRFWTDESRLAEKLASYDVVGINVVVSTIESAASITRKIRANIKKNAACCKIVVGGHAPTLLRPSRLRDAGISFDYFVIGPGELSFETIVRNLDAQPHRQAAGHASIVSGENILSEDADLITNSTMGRERSNSSVSYQRFLERMPWIDRTLFVRGRGLGSYEPSPTRNQIDVEAHLVVSRGCDWKCTFCTEAIVAGRSGENRRSVVDTMGEIRLLVGSRQHVNRIQFIDDNVFPTQPPSARRDVHRSEAGIFWVRDFFMALRERSSAVSEFDLPVGLRWRGLMRMEDFLFYEERMPEFIRSLSDSGCNLLAFGIECGTTEARNRMKGHDQRVIENSTIVDVVKRLKSAGIFVKGYFILGGPGQSKSDIEDTIAFATHANLDLAYFAIYKEFRDISLRAQRERSDEQASLKFGLFAPKIFDTIADPENADSWLEVFGIVPPLEERKGFAETMSDLKLAGFSFEDLIRYNDYHEWEEPYLRMGFAGRHEYLHCLARAYLAFYGRQEWVKCYRALRASGY